MPGLRGIRGFDYSLYLKAIPLLFRNPQIALAPLLAGVANVLLRRLTATSGDGGVLGGATSGLMGFFSTLITGFGLAVAIITADAAWRYGRAPFDEAWEKARNRGGDIIWSAVGISFVTTVAVLFGQMIPVVGSLGLGLIALFFMIFALPAAAIGGIPGAASLQVSVERVRANVWPAVAATAALIVVYVFVDTALTLALEPLVIGRSGFLADQTVLSIFDAFVRAPLDGYIGLVLAKTYEDISYGRRLY